MPLASVVGGVALAVSANALESVLNFGDSTLMCASFGGLAAGSMAAVATWTLQRRRERQQRIPLRVLHTSDILWSAFAAIAVSPLAALAAFATLPVIDLLMPAEIETPWIETLIDMLAMSLPATLFFLPCFEQHAGNSGMPANEEFLARTL